MNSVGKAYAVLKGRMNGDPREAANFLNSMSSFVKRSRNRTEGRMRGRRSILNPQKLGRK